ncbi:MAG TPA: monovalent cation/H(+) antiporter subunit G, partial [Kaistia sp.]|nr:monovalent cation/H(+) antiporter subunit G [Kaistia sp.]
MTGLDDFPLWAAILVSLLLLVGAALTLLGTIGLVRFNSFYERVHAPTLGTTCGAGGILLG